MGQYYKIVNFTKKEIIGGRHGKLTEFCYSGVDAVRELLFLLSDYWKGDEVYIVGDYAEYDSTYNKDEDIEIFDSYNDMEHILKDLYERFDIVEYEDRDEDTPNEKWSLYHLADTFSIIDHVNVPDDFNPRFVINDNEKEYIDRNHMPLAWCYWDKKTKKACPNRMEALVLLLAMGNGMGAGDYYNDINRKMVGSWVKDVRSIRFSDTKPKDYEEFFPDFYEGEYVNYKKIPGKLKKEQMDLDFFILFGKRNNNRKCRYFGKEEGKLVYDDDTLEMSIKGKGGKLITYIYDASYTEKIAFC